MSSDQTPTEGSPADPRATPLLDGERARRERILVVAAALAVGLSRYALRVRVPDDYDSVGFVLAVRDFDLTRFQPQFPGYPVYVVLCRIADRVLHDPLAAATAVSSLAAAATALALWHIGEFLGGRRAGWCALGLYAAAALPWVLGGSALSDGTATAFAVLGFAFLARERRTRGAVCVAAAAIALMVGTRLSYWPIALSWLLVLRQLTPAAERRRTLGWAALAGSVGTLAWLAPLLVAVGARELFDLGRVHLVGHFTDWGGSVVTVPHSGIRVGALLRDLALDGFVPHRLFLFAAAVLAVLAGRGRAHSRSGLVIAALVALPYLIWVLLAQNLVEQPRHVLPLVVAMLLPIAVSVAARPRYAVALIGLVAIPSVPLVLAHARVPSAAAQALDFIQRSFPDRDVAVFGGRSIRSFRYADPSLVTRERAWLSEVDVDLERLNVLPPHIVVTSEITAEGDPRRAARLVEGPTFCRDERLDRAEPCLTLRLYHLERGAAP